ncbi:MAG TPA: UDP-glucose 4-epimerase GalE [Alphaproteobacteria bacterium]|nr:UDP-glucose 4-epimerase GalE [Alphaproteobacteria bacterium]HOO52217.1 UDP-glucose 4-epimerase GalE [Alphaproteobacteria bacterium]
MSDNKNIIVTGGAGYIGSHTCKALSASGYTPVVIDNLSKGHQDAVKWGPLEQVDIRNTPAISQILSTYAPKAIIHFAALSEVGESVKDPAKYFDNNVGGSLSLLQAMRSSSVKNIVFSSSCSVYGEPQRIPIDEDTPCQPVNPYGTSKYMVELFLEDFRKAYGLNYASLRYFNACGADPDGEIGERHDPETHLIPRALMVAAGLENGLNLFGEDYNTPDGTCVRDYIHVNDLATAHIKALEHLCHGGEPLTLNLGTGKGTSVRQIIETTEKVTGTTLPVTISPRRKGDPASLVANPRKAREVLGFETEWNDLEKIIRTAWNFLSPYWEQKSERIKNSG